MQPFGQQSTPQASAPAPAGRNIDISKMNPDLLKKLVEAACSGKLGPEAKQMADAAEGQSSTPQQPGGDQGGDQTTQPPQPQPGRMMGSRNIFGRPGMGAPQASDEDDDDQNSQQEQAPMGARRIFGR